MGWFRRLFRHEQEQLLPEPATVEDGDKEDVPDLLVSPSVVKEEPLMSVEGDALRAQADALVAAKPALASMRDWWAYWKQPPKATAYATVYNNADADAATLRTLAAKVDGDQPPPSGSGFSGQYAAGYSEGTTAGPAPSTLGATNVGPVGVGEAFDATVVTSSSVTDEAGPDETPAPPAKPAPKRKSRPKKKP